MRHTFFCIDGHTAGNPVRLVSGGAPLLQGASMSERRQDFLARFDWIRTGLMFEPRGHDMMSGGFLYPPTREDTDIGVKMLLASDGKLTNVQATDRPASDPAVQCIIGLVKGARLELGARSKVTSAFFNYSFKVY